MGNEALKESDKERPEAEAAHENCSADPKRGREEHF